MADDLSAILFREELTGVEVTGNDLYGPLGWAITTEQSLDNHLVRHLNPSVIDTHLPSNDIETAYIRGFAVSKFLKKAYQILESSDEELSEVMKDSLSAETYRTKVTETLLYAHALGICDVDWDRVDAAVPQAKEVHIDTDRVMDRLGVFEEYFPDRVELDRENLSEVREYFLGQKKELRLTFEAEVAWTTQYFAQEKIQAEATTLPVHQLSSADLPSHPERSYEHSAPQTIRS